MRYYILLIAINLWILEFMHFNAIYLHFSFHERKQNVISKMFIIYFNLQSFGHKPAEQNLSFNVWPLLIVFALIENVCFPNDYCHLIMVAPSHLVNDIIAFSRLASPPFEGFMTQQVSVAMVAQQ